MRLAFHIIAGLVGLACVAYFVDAGSAVNDALSPDATWLTRFNPSFAEAWELSMEGRRQRRRYWRSAGGLIAAALIFVLTW